MTTFGAASFEAIAPPDYPRLFPERRRESARRRGAVERLAAGMLAADREVDERDRRAGSAELPAGYTYFAQFLAHDISFRTTATARPNVAPQASNERIPLLDLDGLYGGGPRTAPYLYQRGRPAMFLVGGRRDPSSGQAGSPVSAADDDLPRNHQGLALIADARNDATVMTGQLHLSLLLAHNRLAYEHVRERGARNPLAAFEGARRELRWTYQWLVANDFLPRILDESGRDWLRSALEARAGGHRIGTRFYKPWLQPGVPLEFAVALFRFGHSMVRPRYALNTRLPDTFPLTPESWRHAPADLHLSGATHLPAHWTVDWELFLDPPGGKGGGKSRTGSPQRSRPLDPQLTWHLGNLPPLFGPGPSLPLRTLGTGEALGLPSGQEVARAVGVEPLELDDVPAELRDDTPLWYYTLAETKLEDHLRLGPMASTLVAETVVGLLDVDPDSYLTREPTWTPSIGAGERTHLADLLTYGRAEGPWNAI